MKFNVRKVDPRRKQEWLDYYRHVGGLARAGSMVKYLGRKEILEVDEEFNEILNPGSCSKIQFAEVAGKPVGMIKYFCAEDIDTAEIERLHVDPNFRGYGIGTELVERVIEESRIMDCRMIVLTPLRDAVEFYENLGFVGVGFEWDPQEMVLEL